MKVLLIDADNFNSPQWIEESIAKLQAQWGQFSVLRAYGSATNLKAIHSVMGK